MDITRRSLIGAVVAVAPSIAAATDTRPGLREQLLRAWSLVEAVTIRPNGETLPWLGRPGPHTGLIIYAPSGMMSVQIASPRPVAKAPPDIDDMPPAERLKYLGTYYGYFGRFELDNSKSEVHQIIENSLDPTEVGLVYVRKVALSGGRLTLTTEPRQIDGEARHNRLIWTRA